jgi:hypothetical protein
MSTSSETTKVPYAGDGSTTAFPFSYPFHAQGDIVVVLKVDATEVETVKTITTHYTISGTATDGKYLSGGTINMLVAPAVGETLILYRDPDFTQENVWTENGGDPAKVKEHSFDKLTFLAQRIKEVLFGRVIRFMEGTDLSGITMVVGLPTAYQALRMNGDEDGFEWFDTDAADGITYTPPSNAMFSTADDTQEILDDLHPRIHGSTASPTSVVAGTALSPDAAINEQTWFVQGSGGAVTVSANPQIVAGTKVGQKLRLYGCSDTNTLKYANGTGLKLNRDCKLGIDTILSLFWNGTDWAEEGRANDIP